MSTEFGKYVLQRKLAEGGMAEVFLAKQSGMEGFEKPVVVKRILPHLTSDPKFVEMFINEARVAARLSHPSIVQIFDLGKVGDQYFITMEFIQGEDLRQIAKAAEERGSKPSLPLATRIIADMLGGLHYAHTRSGPDGKPLGLVHRDVSPQNVLVTYQGGVKLVDFGIAKATQSAGDQQTQAGLLKGKYAYMSPEQCRSKRVDARSDIFSAGILLWELITWRRLFRRESDLATLVAVADEAIPPLSSARGDVPPELERIVTKALARSVGDRYPTAQAMQADLEAVIRKYAWEADSIALQRYMRGLFAAKLRAQDDAVRAAGVGSFEDLLVSVEESSAIAWMDSAQENEHDPATMSLGGTLEPPPAPPADTRPVPLPLESPPLYIAPVPAMRHIEPGSAPLEMTGSTLRHAVGQAMPRGGDRATGRTGAIVAPPSRGLRRALIVAGTSILLASAVVTAVLWPGSVVEVPPLAEAATVHLVLDDEAQIFVDGERQLPGKVVDLTVAAKTPHELRVKRGKLEKRAVIPALDVGAVHPLSLNLTVK